MPYTLYRVHKGVGSVVHLGYGTKGLQFQSYKNAKKKGNFL